MDRTEPDIAALLRETYLRLYGPPAPEQLRDMVRTMELEIRNLRRAKT
jgi:hypothetical protein